MPKSICCSIPFKALISYVFFEVLLVAVLFLLYTRYANWGIPLDKVISFVCVSFVSLSVVLYEFVYVKSGPLTPIFAYSIFVFLFGYSFLPLNTTNISLDVYTILLLITSVFFFIIGIGCGKLLKITYIPSFRIRNGVFLLRWITYLGVIVFIIESAILGYIPIFGMFTKDVYGDSVKNALPFIHYFVQLANVVPVWCYILYKEGKIDKRLTKRLSFIAIFISVNSLSRQGWLLTILCFSIAYMYYNVISKKKIIIIGVSFILLFGLIGTIRSLSIIKDDRSELQYLKDYAQTEYDANVLETYLALYSTNNFSTFKQLAENSDKEDYRAFGAYTLRPFYSITFLNKFSIFDIQAEFDSLSRLGTYAIDPYLDFGICGIVILNFFYGFFSGYSYKNYRKKDYRWIMPWCAMVYCILMSAFTNYFNTLFIWLIIVFNFIVTSTHRNTDKATTAFLP